MTIRYAGSASLASVSSVVAACSAGDTVVVPAGTADWTGGLTISGIQLIGAGTLLPATAVSGTIITAGAVTMTKHASQYTRCSGFSFTGTDNHFTIGGNPSDKAFIADHNYIFSNGGIDTNRMVICQVNGGLFHHNAFVLTPASGADIFNVQTSETWNDTHTMGTADTTGERNIYFEDNTWNGIVETGPDGDSRARLVHRHEVYTDSSIVYHSGYSTTAGYCDTTVGGGTRHFEIYDCNFKRASNSVALNKWIWIRGATGVVFRNKFDRASSPDGSTYPNKPDIRLTLNCNGGAYPMEYQVGQNTTTPDATPDFPVLIYGNLPGDSSDGTADPYFIDISESASGTPPFTCSNPTFYIQENRDYYQSNQWGWVPYQYPHPLQYLSSNVPAIGHPTMA
jgi:hypothetical protein